MSDLEHQPEQRTNVPHAGNIPVEEGGERPLPGAAPIDRMVHADEIPHTMPFTDEERRLARQVQARDKKGVPTWVKIASPIAAVAMAGGAYLGLKGGSHDKAVATNPSQPVATATVAPSPTETTPTPSAPATVDPRMTFEGFDQNHPATVADFAPVPESATPQEIMTNFDNAMNKVVASDDQTLWTKVRKLYIDSQPRKDGSQYTVDYYIDTTFSENGGGSDQYGGPVIDVTQVTHSHEVQGIDGTPIVIVTAVDKTISHSISLDKMVTVAAPRTTTVAFGYKKDIAKIDGKEVSGWVEVDPANYGVS